MSVLVVLSFATFLLLLPLSNCADNNFLIDNPGDQDIEYSNTWTVQFRAQDGKTALQTELEAKKLAAKYNLRFMGEVLPETGIYEMQCKEMPARCKEGQLCPCVGIDLEQQGMENSIHIERQVIRAKQLLQFEDDYTLEFKDPLWNETWYLNPNSVTTSLGDTNGGMNVMEAWKQDITGKGVRVAHVDAGIDNKHPDLIYSYDRHISTDLVDNDNDPYNVTEENSHGTNMAGIVSASPNNSICSVGVAFDVSQGMIRISIKDSTDSQEAKSFSFARDIVDIYISGWGLRRGKLDGPGILTRKALQEGVAKGRKGKGNIFMWAGGNSGQYGDNCGYDGYINSIYTIAINAVSQTGSRPTYGEKCSAIMAGTHSNGRSPERYMVTTGVNGTCTKRFSGTSSSVAVAGGILALVLEANPRLTWRDMQHLIVRSSRRDILNADQAEWVRNGAGHTYSTTFGFGLLDAAQLVSNAKKWRTLISQQQSCKATTKPNAVIDPNAFGTATINLPSGCEVRYLEHVLVTVDIDASKRGDVELHLTSPQGTKVTILEANRFAYSPGGFHGTTILSLGTWGENPEGAWTLKLVHKGTAGSFFTKDIYLNEFSMKWLGTSQLPTRLVAIEPRHLS